MDYHRFQLSSIDASSVSSLLPKELQFSQPVVLKESNSFIMLIPPAMVESVSAYLELIDLESNGYAIELKYIKGEDLMENPPPSVKKEELIKTNNPNIIYFKGSEIRYENFLNDLRILDRPIPQIRYEILVMQVKDKDTAVFNLGLSDNKTSVGTSKSDDGNAFLGTFGNLLSLNFDIVSQFGLTFATTMNVEISNEQSRIMADTTLNALSGEKTHFQNTETYRYPLTEIDPDSGEEQKTGVTKEITSGLTIDIEGWISGDGMITMDVSSQISSRGTGEKKETTTESIVNTFVRTETGTPVIIGGLMFNDFSKKSDKTPLLGDIPLLGNVFRSKDDYNSKTEMIITIVPYLEYPDYSLTDVERDIENLYNRFIRQ